jgi:hypothetical protein
MIILFFRFVSLFKELANDQMDSRHDLRSGARRSARLFVRA